MEVDKVADKVADMVTDMVADMVANKDADKKENWHWHQHGNQIWWDSVSHRGWLLGPNFFDLKLTRLACLLSFASLFATNWSKIFFIFIYDDMVLYHDILYNDILYSIRYWATPVHKMYAMVFSQAPWNFMSQHNNMIKWSLNQKKNSRHWITLPDWKPLPSPLPQFRWAPLRGHPYIT